MEADGRRELTAPEIESEVLAFVREELLGAPASVGREDALLSGDLLDSMAVLRLTAFVEETFQIKVHPSDFVVENFENVARIADYVLRVSER